MLKLARLSLIPIGLLQFLVPVLPSVGIGETIGARAVAEGIPPELPLGIFFSIWGPIFLGYLALGVLANVSPNRVEDTLAPPLALAGLGNVIWILSSQMFGQVWLDISIIVMVLLCAWEAARRLDLVDGFDGTPRRLLACFVVGMLAGWLTAATSISVPDFARWVAGQGVSDNIWLSLWSAIITGSGLVYVFASRVSRSLWFFVAFGWGLAGVAANNWWRTETHGLAIATIVVGLIIIWMRLKRGAPGSKRLRA